MLLSKEKTKEDYKKACLELEYKLYLKDDELKDILKAYNLIHILKEKDEEKINKAIHKLYCYGEVFDREILKQFQKEMLDILQGEENGNKVIEEIPQFEGTLDQLDKITIFKGE